MLRGGRRGDTSSVHVGLPGMEDETGIINLVAVTVRKTRKGLGLSQEYLALEASWIGVISQPGRAGAPAIARLSCWPAWLAH